MTRLNLIAWLNFLLILVMAIAACGGRSTPILESATNESSSEIAVALPASAPRHAPMGLGGKNLRFEHISIEQGLS